MLFVGLLGLAAWAAAAFAKRSLATKVARADVLEGLLLISKTVPDVTNQALEASTKAVDEGRAAYNSGRTNVVARESDWLQISHPVRGWVWGPLTKQVCSH